MVGFRNRVGHGYQDVSDERVYEILTGELDDIEETLRALEAAALAAGSDGGGTATT